MKNEKHPNYHKHEEPILTEYQKKIYNRLFNENNYENLQYCLQTLQMLNISLLIRTI